MCFVYGGEYKETELKKRTLWKYEEDVGSWGGRVGNCVLDIENFIRVSFSSIRR